MLLNLQACGAVKNGLQQRRSVLRLRFGTPLGFSCWRARDELWSEVPVGSKVLLALSNNSDHYSPLTYIPVE